MVSSQKVCLQAENYSGIEEMYLCTATLRLAPLLPTKVAMAQFKNVEQAVSAVQEILNAEYGSHIRP